MINFKQSLLFLILVAWTVATMAEGLFLYGLGEDTYAGRIEISKKNGKTDWYLITCDGSAIELADNANLKLHKNLDCVNQNKPVALLSSHRAVSVIPEPWSPCGGKSQQIPNLENLEMVAGMGTAFQKDRMNSIVNMWEAKNAPTLQIEWARFSNHVEPETKTIYGMASGMLLGASVDPCGGGNPKNCPNCREDIELLLREIPDWTAQFSNPEKHDGLIQDVTNSLTQKYDNVNTRDIKVFTDAVMRQQTTFEIFSLDGN